MRFSWIEYKAATQFEKIIEDLYLLRRVNEGFVADLVEMFLYKSAIHDYVILSFTNETETFRKRTVFLEVFDSLRNQALVIQGLSAAEKGTMLKKSPFMSPLSFVMRDTMTS